MKLTALNSFFPSNQFTKKQWLFSVYFILLLFFSSCAQKSNFVQPELGIRSVQLLEKNGFQFKDLNKNGKLDKYEDWRLSADERANDLAGQMNLEEKVGFMLISTINMGSKDTAISHGPLGRMSEVTSDLDERDVIMDRNFFTRQPLPQPVLNVSGTTKGVNERHLRHFILRANTNAKTICEWSNNLQTLAESTRLGIPVLVTSNPRNHITIDNSTGLGHGETGFSKWPGELGTGCDARFPADPRIC